MTAPVDHEAAKEIADNWNDPDNLFVVGDTRSNNAQRVQQAHLARAYLALRAELAAANAALKAAYIAADHVAIAGSYDNLKEGQRYIIAWRLNTEHAAAIERARK